MTISKTPTRIDLAGGTLDLWPISQMVPKSQTINLAIDLFSEARIEERIEGSFRFFSHDLNQEITLDRESLLTKDSFKDLELLLLATQFFLRNFSNSASSQPFTLETRSVSLVGAGLGGSSSLLISILGGLNSFFNAKLSSETLIEIAKNLETKAMKKPAGVQDYYPPVHGGILKIEFLEASTRVVPYVENLKSFFDGHLSLVYTGVPHHSGINNWEVLKAFLDGDEKVKRSLFAIRDATLQMDEALQTESRELFIEALKNEWGSRKELSPFVSNEKIESLFQEAFSEGALAGKVCGAGGGGCVFFYSEESRVLDQKLQEKGYQVIPFQLTSQGLTVI